MKTWIVGALVAGGVGIFAMRGCLSKPPPDERLAGHFEDLCDIARANVDTPEKGVRQLGRYLGKHVDEIFGDWGATFAMIEKIKDDDKHDQRARVARDRIRAPLRACERDWMRFGEAVEANPEATELVTEFSERLSRTIDIIFSSRRQLHFRDLPRELEELM